MIEGSRAFLLPVLAITLIRVKGLGFRPLPIHVVRLDIPEGLTTLNPKP
jgi:hypothetical protein